MCNTTHIYPPLSNIYPPLSNIYPPLSNTCIFNPYLSTIISYQYHSTITIPPFNHNYSPFNHNYSPFNHICIIYIPPLSIILFFILLSILSPSHYLLSSIYYLLPLILHILLSPLSTMSSYYSVVACLL